ncbi:MULTISPECIES: PASTA domain-containing protein [unclassified Pseudonocardia]|jgi:hypothetical protein|uniref:PASTA domain-containing protein n=1 Tax=unclassified Pseudonocardia TaxID=2619320 RepID=UPI000964976A|nr:MULTISPECIES: PASTA domain-containing protein [unclassified Pseudonocardia]MBN9097460.1 PASTA domain-containing protein [Pseudonocardia sp.]OJY39799.1 MAG: hypothetical protein BGP03_21140 [Pseudonocardia sp. 73-21]
MGDTWKDGRRAWERLDGWGDGSPARSGVEALRALDDIGTVRRLLDQAELGAVKAARAQKKSWAEIATRLGVTRQSAWERWRDLDEAQQHAGEQPAAGDVLGPELDLAASALTRRAAGHARRQQTVAVPNVVGMSWTTARAVLHEKGLFAEGVGPDGIPVSADEHPNDLVTDQSPESGAMVEPGTVLTLWIGRGGGSAGVREPRRPRPTPLTEHEPLPEPTEAVG